MIRRKPDRNPDIFELHEVSGQMIRDTGDRLEKALEPLVGKLDFELLLKTMEDLTAGKVTIGDIAVVYSYRLTKQAHDG